MSDYPSFLGGLGDYLEHKPHLIVTRIGNYSPRKFRKGIKRLCKHFGIPYSLTSLIAVASMHDYELAIFTEYVFLYRLDSTFADIVVSEPAVLHATLELEEDTKIIQHI